MPVTDARPPASANGNADESVGHRDVGRATGSTVRSGLAWTLAGQWAGYAVQLVTTAVLARLVAPKEFGLLSEALTVTAFAAQLQTLGLSQAVVQRAKLTHGQMSNLFWVNAAAGLGLALLVLASAPLVADFYGDHALIGVTAALGVTYVIAGLGVQHAALMSRRMKFKAIAVRSLVPRVLAGAIAIVAAVFGAGYWALVIQQIAATFFMVLFVWTAIDWRPSWPARRTGVRPLLRFGAGVSVANILYYFSSNADNILVGRVLGTGSLGLYARAYNLFLVPLRQLHGPLGNVVQPVMSAIVGEPERYRAFYRRMLGAITMVGMPGVVFLAVMSREIIVVVLGQRWVGAAEPFRWLAVAGFLQMISRTFTWLFTTSGRSRAMAIWAGISAPVAVASFVVGLHWGITGVATAYAIAQTSLIVPGIWFAVRGTPVHMSDVADAVWRPAVVAGGVGVAVTLVRLALAGSPAVTVLLVGLVVAAVCWACIVWRWPTLRADLLAVKGTITRRNAR